MPIVPIQEAPQEKLQPLDTTPLQPADYGGVSKAVVSGTQELAGAVDKYADQQNLVQTFTDQGNVKGGIAQFQDSNDSRLRTGPNAYLKTQGADAMNGQQDAIAAVIANRDQVAGSMANDRQKGMFSGYADRVTRHEIDAINQHATEQSKVFDNAQSGVLANQSSSSAVIAGVAGDEDAFSGHMNSLTKTLQDNNIQNGLPLEAGVDKAVSNTIKTTVLQMAMSDPQKARIWFDVHRGQMTDQDTVLQTEQALEPYVKDATSVADAMAAKGSMPGAPASAPVSDPATLAAKIGHAENSTGNPSAKNPMSSAQGPDQFTDQTWLGTMKQHGPANFAAAIVKQGNKYVIADQSQAPAIWAARNDPAQSQQATIALAQDNKVALGRAGVPVDDGSAYLAHVFGAGGAVALLKADQNAPAATVVGAKAASNNAGMGKTVGDMISYAYQKMGGSGPSTQGASPAFAPRVDDLNSQLAWINSQPWTLDRKQAAISKVQSYAAVDKNLLDAQQADARNKAFTVAITPGTTSIRDIPPDVFSMLKPEDKLAVQAAIKHNVDGDDAPVNPTLYGQFTDSAAKGTLKVADVMPAYGQMPLDDWKHFMTLAQAIDKHNDKSVVVTQGYITSAIAPALNAKLPLADPTLKKQAAADFRQTQSARRYTLLKAVNDDVQVWEQSNPGKKPLPKDIQAMADRRLMQTNVGQTTPGWFSNTPVAPRYQFESQPGEPGRVSIPTADVQRLRSIGTRALGRTPTDDEIVQAYAHEARGGN